MNGKIKAAPIGSGNYTKAILTDHPNHCKDSDKLIENNKSISESDVLKARYVTEKRMAVAFFYSHPDREYSRADLCDQFQLPINHVTRIVCNLLDSGYIAVNHKGINPRSRRLVEYLKLVRHE